jgi:hypothetical protein
LCHTSHLARKKNIFQQTKCQLFYQFPIRQVSFQKEQTVGCHPLHLSQKFNYSLKIPIQKYKKTKMGCGASTTTVQRESKAIVYNSLHKIINSQKAAINERINTDHGLDDLITYIKRWAVVQLQYFIIKLYSI